MKKNANYVVTLAHAVCDENGKGVNGKAGDQTGSEVRFQPWYLREAKWDAVLRAKKSEKRLLIAEDAIKGVRNPNVGYDMNDRYTAWNACADKGYDLSKIDKPSETDCSQMAGIECNYAGIKIPKTVYSGNFVECAKASKGFKEPYTDSKHTDSADYLKVGDILVGKGHVATVVNTLYRLTMNLRYVEGNLVRGNDVKALQTRLNELGYNCGTADGVFGQKTHYAVEAFQIDNNLEADGVCGRKTAEALGFLFG